MHNSNKPSIDELPSTARLIKSTIIAAIAAVLILITVVLPAEYGIDPTRIGHTLGLTHMGEIKHQLSEEAGHDDHSQLDTGNHPGLFGTLLSMIIPTAHANTTSDEWDEVITFTLEPGEGKEIKLEMQADATATFMWEAVGGRMNFDLHGHGGGQSVSYKKGRGVDGDEGELIAAFAGKHGWFWRNRDRQDVTVNLYVKGDFSQVVHSE